MNKIVKMTDVATNLRMVQEKILAASSKRPVEYKYFEPRLVAVSKLKPPELIVEVYEAGQRHFGENYVNELVEKGSHPNILEKCEDIRWHFIGHLQRNKVNKILSVPNLYVIETVDNEKISSALNTSWPKFRNHDDLKLKVMVQVNTSKEEEKSGCEIAEAPSLVKHIIDNCTNLEFMGLMTIGRFGYDTSEGPNPDFLCLKECRETVSKELGIRSEDIELSMGMSNDYEQAVIQIKDYHVPCCMDDRWSMMLIKSVELGSTSVRVGSAIFGERPKKGHK